MILMDGFVGRKFIKIDDQGFFDESESVEVLDNKIITDQDRRPAFLNEDSEWCFATEWKIFGGVFFVKSYIQEWVEKHEYDLSEVISRLVFK